MFVIMNSNVVISFDCNFNFCIKISKCFINCVINNFLY